MEILFRKDTGMIVAAKPDGWPWTDTEKGLVTVEKYDKTKGKLGEEWQKKSFVFSVFTIPDIDYLPYKQKLEAWSLKVTDIESPSLTKVTEVKGAAALKEMREA